MPDGSALIVGTIQTQSPTQAVALKFNGQIFTEILRQSGGLARSAWTPNGSYALILAQSSAFAQSGFTDGFAKFDGVTFSKFTNTIGIYEISASWKPDGSYALVVGQNGTVAKLEDGSLRILTSGEYGYFQSVAWKPDGSYALLVGEHGTVLKFDGRNLTRIPTGVDAPFLWVSWRPDGSSALIYGYGTRIYTPSNTKGLGGIVLKFDGDNFTWFLSTREEPSFWPYFGVAAVGVATGLSIILFVIIKKRRPTVPDLIPTT